MGKMPNVVKSVFFIILALFEFLFVNPKWKSQTPNPKKFLSQPTNGIWSSSVNPKPQTPKYKTQTSMCKPDEYNQNSLWFESGNYTHLVI